MEDREERVYFGSEVSFMVTVEQIVNRGEGISQGRRVKRREDPAGKGSRWSQKVREASGLASWR